MTKNTQTALDPRKLADDEAATRDFKVTDNSTVQATATTKAGKKDPDRWLHTLELDFSQVEHDELLELATKTVVILVQSRIRKRAETVGMKDAIRENTAIDVAEVVRAERRSRTADPVETARRALAKMGATPDQIAQMMKELA